MADIEFKNLSTGELVYSLDMLPSQKEFWKAKEKYVLLSGGYGSGKSRILIIKTIFDAISQNNNYILMGRKSYAEIHDVLLKDFMEVCHPSWIKSFKKTPHPSVILYTIKGGTSEIIFRNLDKFSEGEIAGLNLGGVSIDQAEDIPEAIYMAIKGRLRREGVKHRCYMTANPSLSWLYRVFKQETPPDHRIIEASTLENEKNLPPDYIEDLKTYPPSMYKQFVLGVWDEALFSENGVFAPEHLTELSKSLREPMEVREGLEIFKKKKEGHVYQMGIDCAEGTDTIDEKYRNNKKDNAVITLVDMTDNEEVAKFSARLTPSATADKAVLFARWYDNPLMVPEMNSMGTALVNRLQDLGYNNIYRRFEFDRTLNRRTKKLGFRTTASSKALLISRFNTRLRIAPPRIYSKDTYAEMKSFVYSDIAGKKGAGAMEGYHDDKVMSLLLAFYEDKDPTKSNIIRKETKNGIIQDIVPSLEIKNGKFLPPKFWREGKEARWTTL